MEKKKISRGRSRNFMKARSTVSTCGEMRTCVHCWWECKIVCIAIVEAVWRVLKKLKINPPCDSAIPLWGINPKKIKILI